MSKRMSKAMSMELAFLAALDRVHARVDTSEIAEVQDWSGAVRGKFYGAAVQGTSHPQASAPPAIATDAPSPSKAVLGDPGDVASYGSVQYSQIAIPKLIAVGISESSEHAWGEFVRRFQSLIRTVIIRTVRHRFGNVSHDLVDDLTQNVYLNLCANNFRALRNVEILEEGAFFGFLKVVATNTVQDYLRSAHSSKMGGGHEPVLLESDLVVPEHARSSVASSELERGILLEKIDAILKTLSHKPNFARDREIFWLYYRQGLTPKEIAALPGVKLSIKGVERSLLRLTGHIRAALAQETKKPNKGL